MQSSAVTARMEDLGEATIAGLRAHGTRTTRDLDAKAGDDASPPVSTREVWVATVHSMPFTVREVDNDPENGLRTRQLVKLTFGEPDPALFQPPPSYPVSLDEMREIPCGNAH